MILFEHIFYKRHILLETWISTPFLLQNLEKTSNKVTDSYDDQLVHCYTRGYTNKSCPQLQCSSYQVILFPCLSRLTFLQTILGFSIWRTRSLLSLTLQQVYYPPCLTILSHQWQVLSFDCSWSWMCFYLQSRNKPTHVLLYLRETHIHTLYLFFWSPWRWYATKR